VNDAISVEALVKEYRVAEREAGLAASLSALFRRRYRTTRAVDAISFRISPGERVGFLGPNGAGKTTTLKMLAGLLHPTSGTATVAGFEPRRRQIDFLKQITLVMGQKQQLLWDLPPADTFAMNRAIYEIPGAQYQETYGELARLLDLGKTVERPTRQLSLGERMKCELVAALLHRPQVLFLDEPTIGLDVTMQATLREFIAAYNQRFGATIVLTSHYMDDVAALCPRVIVIDGGRIGFDGALADLVHRMRPHKRVVVRTADGQRQELLVLPADLKETLAKILSQPVTDLTVEDPPIEEVMRELFAHTRDTKSA
jgi:ABC-2 type transport system ATP-binding protein